MGGEVVLRCKRILADLKGSWYFRAWLLFWLTLAIVWFIAVGFLANRAEDSSKHKVQQYYIDHESEIEYPEFQLRFPLPPGDSVVEHKCFYGYYRNITVPSEFFKCLKPIDGGEDIHDWCVIVNTKGFKAIRGRGYTDPQANNRLTCTLNITGPMMISQDVQVAFEILKDRAYGPNTGASLWISPNDNAWVLLTKASFNGNTAWERSLLYHSSKSQPLYWEITAVIDSFLVDRYEDRVIYDGWMAAADVGGFISFLMIWHVVAMLIVGLFCVNNSSFLKDEDSEGAAYHTTI
jgi:hypothetical protein